MPDCSLENWNLLYAKKKKKKPTNNNNNDDMKSKGKGYMKSKGKRYLLASAEMIECQRAFYLNKKSVTMQELREQEKKDVDAQEQARWEAAIKGVPDGDVVAAGTETETETETGIETFVEKRKIVSAVLVAGSSDGEIIAGCVKKGKKRERERTRLLNPDGYEIFEIVGDNVPKKRRISGASNDDNDNDNDNDNDDDNDNNNDNGNNEKLDAMSAQQFTFLKTLYKYQEVGKGSKVWEAWDVFSRELVRRHPMKYFAAMHVYWNIYSLVYENYANFSPGKVKSCNLYKYLQGSMSYQKMADAKDFFLKYKQFPWAAYALAFFALIEENDYEKAKSILKALANTGHEEAAAALLMVYWFRDPEQGVVEAVVLRHNGMSSPGTRICEARNVLRFLRAESDAPEKKSMAKIENELRSEFSETEIKIARGELEERLNEARTIRADIRLRLAKDMFGDTNAAGSNFVEDEEMREQRLKMREVSWAAQVARFSNFSYSEVFAEEMKNGCPLAVGSVVDHCENMIRYEIGKPGPVSKEKLAFRLHAMDSLVYLYGNLHLVRTAKIAKSLFGMLARPPVPGVLRGARVRAAEGAEYNTEEAREIVRRFNDYTKNHNKEKSAHVLKIGMRAEIGRLFDWDWRLEWVEDEVKEDIDGTRKRQVRLTEKAALLTRSGKKRYPYHNESSEIRELETTVESMQEKGFLDDETKSPFEMEEEQEIAI